MKRKIENYLSWWKGLGKEKMPLLIHGARQIGKTYAIREFGKLHYENTLYLNFETEPALAHLFNDSISPQKLISKIEHYYSQTATPGKTLIIFDEIQSCNRALTSLKYFCEDAREYDIIGAGSLLGVHINSNEYSFPVGKVISKTMYPLDFEEFLWESDKAVFSEQIEESFRFNKPLEQTLHDSLLTLYNAYLLVGGMPLAVYNYNKRDTILKYGDIQKTIIDTYTSDMAKYSDRTQSLKTIMTYDSIVPQLAKDNKKFQYKLIAKGARASLFGESIDWLVKAGIVLKCEKIKNGALPPNITKDLSAFKLYMGDIGLCCHKAGLTASNMTVFDNSFMGGITENYVANTLVANDYDLSYWESDAKAEVDFIIVKAGRNIPLEVKSNTNTRSYSLNAYMKKYSPEYAIRISKKNFGFENNIKAVPLYAAYLI